MVMTVDPGAGASILLDLGHGHWTRIRSAPGLDIARDEDGRHVWRHHAGGVDDKPEPALEVLDGLGAPEAVPTYAVIEDAPYRARKVTPPLLQASATATADPGADRDRILKDQRNASDRRRRLFKRRQREARGESLPGPRGRG